LTILCYIQYNVVMMNEKTLETIEKLKQEMRRGITVAVVMSRLKQSQYGYALLKSLNDRTLSTPFFGGWKTRNFWTANGAWRIRVRGGTTG
jgi:hypothetical protein